MPTAKENNPDDNTDVVRAVEELTGSKPLNTEECFDSPELQRQFREAKERERLRSQPSRK